MCVAFWENKPTVCVCVGGGGQRFVWVGAAFPQPVL